MCSLTKLSDNTASNLNVKTFYISNMYKRKNMWTLTTRKGVGKGSAPASTNGMTADMVNKLNVGWYYNWGITPDKSITNIPFTPMIWGSSSCTDTNIAKLSQDIPAMDNCLLGFNEPDHPKQSNMSVDEAIGLWPKLMSTNRRLGSPVMAGDCTVSGCWLEVFMKKCKSLNYRVDFICVHWYKAPDPSKFEQYLEAIHDKYNLPIWITEFCPVDNHPVTYKSSNAINFLNIAVPQLNGHKSTFIERYAIHTREALDANHGFAALFHTDGTIRDVGVKYASYKNQTS